MHLFTVSRGTKPTDAESSSPYLSGSLAKDDKLAWRVFLVFVQLYELDLLLPAREHWNSSPSSCCSFFWDMPSLLATTCPRRSGASTTFVVGAIFYGTLAKQKQNCPLRPNRIPQAYIWSSGQGNEATSAYLGILQSYQGKSIEKSLMDPTEGGRSSDCCFCPSRLPRWLSGLPICNS